MLAGRRAFDGTSAASVIGAILKDDPACSWPETYYVITLPAYGCVVITASADTEDSFGRCDVALGHFSASRDVLAGAKALLLNHWRGGSRWEYLFDEGLVDASTAATWADEVWGAEEE
jgi:hypothetical protein